MYTKTFCTFHTSSLHLHILFKTPVTVNLPTLLAPELNAPSYVQKTRI